MVFNRSMQEAETKLHELQTHPNASEYINEFIQGIAGQNFELILAFFQKEYESFLREPSKINPFVSYMLL